MRSAYSSRNTRGALWKRPLLPPLGRHSPQGIRELADEICVFLKEYEGGAMETDLSRSPHGGAFLKEYEG